jgi:molecular chaperone DnaK
LTERSAAFPTFHLVIGIDLGTTSSAVSVWDGSKLVLIPGPAGDPIVPSTLAQNDAGQVLVGLPPSRDSTRTVTGVKRELGTGEPIRFRGRSYQPREMCAFLLIELKRQAEAYLGVPVHDAVITVPTAAGEPQRRALREAAGLAQLNVRRLLDDPVAAAMAFGAADRQRTYAIYDLGGGTFDTAIVRSGPGAIEVLGTSGDPRLGGDDFDELIVEYALRQIRDRHHVDLSQDQRIRLRIRREAEIRKRELATAESADLQLPLLTATVNAVVPLPRRTFETMIEPDVQRSLDHVSAALAAAEEAHGVGRADVEQVLLAGGSTRIPWIRERLADFFGLSPGDVRADLDPEELNARGAGLIAREYEPALLFEGSPPGLLAANLRLRAEMADPATDPVLPEPPPTNATGPPAETPADFRPIAERAHDLLAASPLTDHAALRAAYAAFLTAIVAAAPDAHLAELGKALKTEYDRLT